MGEAQPQQAFRRLEDELRALYFDQFGPYAEDCLIIRPKAGPLCAFALNEVQAHVDYLASIQRAQTGRIRAIVLKCRQSGISTYIQGRFYRGTTFHVGFRAFVLTHEDKATQNLFGIAKRYHDNVRPEFRPKTQRSNRIELDFSEIDSSYRVATAKTKDTGRSDTVQLFHGSEVAFWPDIRGIASGVLEAVPDAPDTEVWLESTANGRANHFYDLWQGAKEGRTGYLPIFVPWHEVSEYSDACPQEVVFTKDERALAEKYELSQDQLWWRRKKIEAFAVITRSEEAAQTLFAQEYPSDDVEAFTYSGGNVFSAAALAALARQVAAPVAVGTLAQFGDTIRFQENSEGWLEVYLWPDDDLHCVIGADVAEGLETGDKVSGQVLARPGAGSGRLRQAACFRPQVAVDSFGELCVLVAKYYGGNVPVAIERTGNGIAAVMAAVRTGYPHVYRMGTSPDQAKRKDWRYGFTTNAATKPQLVYDLAGVIQDMAIEIYSSETHTQLGKYTRDKANANKTAAEEGEYDDEVMGLGIALQCHRNTRPMPRERRWIGPVNPDKFNVATAPWDG